jgi:predicted transcriptional regulator
LGTAGTEQTLNVLKAEYRAVKKGRRDSNRSRIDALARTWSSSRSLNREKSISDPVSLDTRLTNDDGDQGGRYGLARAKIGELMMRLELAEHLIEKRGLADEWKKSRR